MPQKKCGKSSRLEATTEVIKPKLPHLVDSIPKSGGVGSHVGLWRRVQRSNENAFQKREDVQGYNVPAPSDWCIWTS